ncbi:MAG: hypothetical protein BJ554DRAFT_3905 [Olpidium bornovanus]|uniref:Uncharacterized protein n=1 Tax=Olpidium bornovanus TaxID=278681 RepID=A0A8H8A0H8_9FUNG|nr:MAG: hypothetical protein BJ554DRAFT_3905 [Olpidium bornovanus]
MCPESRQTGQQRCQKKKKKNNRKKKRVGSTHVVRSFRRLETLAVVKKSDGICRFSLTGTVRVHQFFEENTGVAAETSGRWTNGAGGLSEQSQRCPAQSKSTQFSYAPASFSPPGQQGPSPPSPPFPPFSPLPPFPDLARRV